MWTIVVLLLTFQRSLDNTSIRVLAAESLLVFSVGLWSITRVTPRGSWSPASVFFVVLAIFHIGLTPYWLFGKYPDLVRTTDTVWFFGPVGVYSLWVVMLAMASYVLGVVGWASFPRPVPSEEQSRRQSARGNNTSADHYAFGGSCILLGGILLWAYLAYSSGGPTIFFGSYTAFLAATSSSGISQAYVLIGLGLGLCMISVSKPFVRFGIAIFLIFALVAFFLGLRGEVLFALAVAASVLAARRKLPSGMAVAGAAFVLLGAINGAKNIRSSGIGSVTATLSDFNPMEAIVELGSTMRVVAETVNWHVVNSEPFRSGDTYAVSVIRFVELALSPSTRLPASADFRLMNTEIRERTGAIGGSIIGEAYHNFDVVGAMVVLLLVGILFSLFSRAQVTNRSLAIYVCVAVPLFNHIRNSFVPVLPQIVLGLVALVAIELFARKSPVKYGAEAGSADNLG